MYPENPASWLVLEEWKDKEPIDFEIELNKLSRSLSRLIKAKDLYAGHLRAIPLNRLFKHNKLFLQAGIFDDLASLLPKYPVNCSEDEQYHVQQFARITMNQTFMIADRYKSRSWPKYFWRHIYLVPICVATQIYSMCQELAVNNLGCPPQDESLQEFKKVTEAFNKVFDKFE